jgi:hypothetical protein
MKNAFMSRAVLFSAGLAYSAVIAVAACGGERKEATTDTSAAAGVIDQAPVTTAAGVAALLADENVFALLDSAYVEIIKLDEAAQKQATNPQIRDFARGAVSQNVLGHKAVAQVKDRLHIPEVFPDKKLLKLARKGMDELGSKPAADYDKAYLDVVIATRDEAIDEIDDALKGTRITQQAIKDLLTQVKSNFEADKKTAEDLKSKLK